MTRLTTYQYIPISEHQVQLAYRWLCKQRLHFPANADIWSFRFNWHIIKPKLMQQVSSGHYVFSPLACIKKANGSIIHCWCSQDALILKLLTYVLDDELSLSPLCKHIKGHGGLKQCVVDVQRHVSHYQFACKTDVRHFYESINHTVLINLLYDQIANLHLRRYLYQAIHRTVESGGHYREIKKGIARGCPISPILGALYLNQLDEAFAKQGVYYTRYMDDILILSKTRWHNRQAVRQMNQIFNQLKVEQHPDKTFIGYIAKGFDFLGYHFSEKRLQLAPITIKKHVKRFNQLYEQQTMKKATSNEMALVLGYYVKRWQCWCTAGLGNIKLETYDGSQESLATLERT